MQLFRYNEKIAEIAEFHAETRLDFAETLPSNNGFNFLAAKSESLQASPSGLKAVLTSAALNGL